jgi:hypothetical protein
MKHKLYFLVLALFVWTGVTQTSWAQLRTKVAIFSSYDDNAFRNALGQTDFITTTALSLEYQPNKSNFSLFVNGNMNLFKDYFDRRYFSNSFGAAFTKPFGDEDENAFSTNATYFMRFNKERYNYYDFSQFVGSLNIKYYLDSEEGLLSRAGYRLRYRNYRNLEEFSYLEHYGFVQLSRFFETKTTVSAEVDFGNKNYVMSPSAYSTAGSSTGTWGMMGNGGMTGNGEMMGNGERWSHGGGNMDPTTRLISYSSPNTTQLIGIVRVAQSITQTTGLSVQYLRRWDLSDRTRFLSNGAVDYQGDEELWDDPYGYHGDEYNAALTQVLPWEMTIRISADYLVKDYARRIFTPTDTDVPTGPLRSDTRLVGSVEVRKTLETDWAVFNGIMISVSYFYQKNNSNDPYYNFRNNNFSLGIMTQL